MTGINWFSINNGNACNSKQHRDILLVDSNHNLNQGDSVVINTVDKNDRIYEERKIRDSFFKLGYIFGRNSQVVVQLIAWWVHFVDIVQSMKVMNIKVFLSNPAKTETTTEI